ncbi:MAG: hypothetical protein ACYC3I_22385 [Gemmataceae bacterium]
MSVNWKSRLPLAAAAILFVAALIVMARSQPAQAQRDAVAGPAPRYTVIETQGFNLLVTDNAANKLYYYATDKDAAVGSPLKLRASLDLSKIGQEEIVIKTHNLENMRKKEEKK